ncbi:SRPBCC family protein [Streptomyces physcomitrii]|uniref:Polyketide cyclase n=1 Tax=Streptomyces physcomitrii TaxID=2724184 RepID=A0ABX1H9W8_9ACTN|nr:SRPBCC family protein [Streptomyces physcomitrii]NKI44024.1 polyketide cyclase [Streptomyces physcomitrii]
MNWCHYRFRSVWYLPARPALVGAVLEDAENYPLWWPQVREVLPLDEHSGRARFRSVLPVDLVVTARERRRDPGSGVLEIEMSGDLQGWARWTVRTGPGGAGTRAVYEQEVEVRKPLMRRLAVPGRAVFLANHALMMRAGRRGLRAHLERLASRAEVG